MARGMDSSGPVSLAAPVQVMIVLLHMGAVLAAAGDGCWCHRGRGAL